MTLVTLPYSTMEGTSGTGQRTSCDSCKRSKLKCIKQPESDKCTRCTARNTECQVTLVSRKKREKKIHYLSAIEDRMKRMESAMNASGITLNDSEIVEAALPAVSAQSALEDELSIFVINDDGASGFVGASSGFSLFSPQGLRWISEKTGNRDFEHIIKGVASTCDHSPGGGGSFPSSLPPINRSEREPLPPKDVANEYLATFFDTFNAGFPLFDKESVMKRFGNDYFTVTRERDPAWYASLNIMFLIGRAIGMKSDGSDPTCEKYFYNASSVFTELLFNGPSLMAVQAMVGMAFVLHAGEDPHPSYVLIGTASRLAQAIGLHRRLDGYGLTQREIKQRRNVFWIALGLEKGISLRSGRPSVFSDDDIGVELPDRNPHANKNLASEDSVLDTFYSTATLGLLESRVYSKLYSARSHTKTELERLKWVGALDKELQKWREEFPIEVRPEEPIKCHSKHMVHVVTIHFAYYNCLVAIHRGSIHHGSWVNDKKPEMVRDAKSIGLNPRVFESGAICLKAARQTIGLLRHYDSNDPHDRHTIGIVSLCNYYPLTASLTLFANILQNPTSPSSITDIALMNSVTRILANNISSAANPKAAVHLQIFKEIIRVAATFVAKARGQPASTYLDPAELPTPQPETYSPLAGDSPSGSGTDASTSNTPSHDHPLTRRANKLFPAQRGPPYSTPSPASPPPHLPLQLHYQPHAFPASGASDSPKAHPVAAGEGAYNSCDFAGMAAVEEAQGPSVDMGGFDFNSYAWQGGDGGFGGAGMGEFGGPVDGYAAQGLDAGMVGMGGMEMPMVFQWDLADIWQGREMGR